ncbi:MAG: hypothetical protein ACK56F_24790, partial [bacterium]
MYCPAQPEERVRKAMNFIMMEAYKVRALLAPLAWATQLRAFVHSRMLLYRTSSHLTIISQILRGMLGQYSR